MSAETSATVETLHTDILILGSGGAGLFAALHAKEVEPALRVTIAVKGLLGKCGCTRMVQGGYNVALSPGDSVERHFMDTIEGGKWLNRQDLVWTLVTVAQTRIRQLENELGCFFDRNPDGTIHQKAFAGQSFDRTVHKGDLTGIEIINRLMEHVWSRNIDRLEDHRAVALIPAATGEGVSGVLLVDMRSGTFRLVQAKAVLLATGGGPTMYKYHTPSGDKSCDGMAMALRAGLPLRDLEMVQFHPTGLLAGADTRMTGTVLEEGLRGAGGWLLDGNGERFMAKYDERGERATRDIVSRAMFEEIRAGNTSPLGGLYLQMHHLGAEAVRRQFKGMVERCADCGFDLAGGRVEVVPTAHYMMGGIEFENDCRTAQPGLYAAGEDTGGVHGANRLGGNGVANSTVFGGLAGEAMAAFAARNPGHRDPNRIVLERAIAACTAPLHRPAANLHPVRERLHHIMWEQVGVIRDGAGLADAAQALGGLDQQLDELGVPGATLAFNLAWHDWLDLKNLILVSRAVATAALARINSRGAHYRSDFPDPGPVTASDYTRLRFDGENFAVDQCPVEFSLVRPGESLLPRDQAEGA